jgi:dephospho-CoA kinase
MLTVGITGGIGSGKSTVCRIFESLGIPVYYADDRGKWLMNNSPELKQALIDAFGKNTYLPDGALNRKWLADQVFPSPELLSKLNSIVHPAVFVDSFKWQQEQFERQVPYTLREAALLFESGSYKHVEKVIVVSAPEDIRIARVIARDHTDEISVKQRIDKQMPEDEKVSRADYVIQNDGQTSLIDQVLAIHRQLLELSTVSENEN